DDTSRPVHSRIIAYRPDRSLGCPAFFLEHDPPGADRHYDLAGQESGGLSLCGDEGIDREDREVGPAPWSQEAGISFFETGPRGPSGPPADRLIDRESLGR